jgi:hypothetical protein
MLHFTNGSIAVSLLQQAHMRGDIVAWDDVLHEGPVPAGLGLAALRARRAAFLASCGWGTIDNIARDLARRDGYIERAGEHDEILLWFEHDLYDQLQLLQILDLLPDRLTPVVSMPAVPDYLGLLSIDQIEPLFLRRQPLTGAHRSAARDAWAAFRAPDPRALVDVLPRVQSLPHLGPALVRHLQQFPSVSHGLSRTEHQALTVMTGGESLMREIYRRSHHEGEEAVFMGDAGFLHHIGALLRTARPLIQGDRSGSLTLDSRVHLTADGERVMAREADRVVLSGIDRWLGGVQLVGHGPVWRWDEVTRAVVVR